MFNRAHNVNGKFVVEENSATLKFDGVEKFTIEHLTGTRLPIALAKDVSTKGAHANICILSYENDNLTISQTFISLIRYAINSATFQNERFLLW